ncbi:DUF2256 domain-containing protein [Undibacterium sp. SXout11W]|uniref:DUF2256 domain-containing protein n=1 Tax=Undibacterium sp. SXout11W TaxID=3413050 RepID=UPI003BF1CE9E
MQLYMLKLVRITAMRMRKKANLPSKLCPCCLRPFVWRKKWEKVWNEVKYCSERCRSASKGRAC